MNDYRFDLPDVGEGLSEGEIVHWHVREGDAVAADQVIVDVQTDKAVVEIPAPVAGTVKNLGGAVDSEGFIYTGEVDSFRVQRFAPSNTPRGQLLQQLSELP